MLRLVNIMFALVVMWLGNDGHMLGKSQSQGINQRYYFAWSINDIIWFWAKKIAANEICVQIFVGWMPNILWRQMWMTKVCSPKWMQYRRREQNLGVFGAQIHCVTTMLMSWKFMRNIFVSVHIVDAENENIR